MPASPLAGKALINDLDLQVTEPGGLTHLPMVLDPSPANVNNNAVEGADHVNNIEQVLVNNPPSRKLHADGKRKCCTLRSYRSFYLAYEIIPNSVTVEYPFGGETWVQDKQKPSGGVPMEATPIHLRLNILPTAKRWATISNNIPSASRSYNWVCSGFIYHQCPDQDNPQRHQLFRSSDYPFTIFNSTLTATNTCPGYTRLNWNTIPGADHYEVLKLSGDTMQVIASTTDSVYLVTPLNKDSGYWFSVRYAPASTAGGLLASSPYPTAVPVR